MLGKQLVVDTILIFADQLFGRAQDGIGRAIILREMDQPEVRVIITEAKHVPVVGPPPGVNPLVQITHHKDVSMPPGQHLG